MILFAGPAALEAPAFGAVTLKWAGTEGIPAARGGYVAFSTRSIPPKNGDVSGPPELWSGVAANPQRIITAQAPAPSFDSLTITNISNLVVDDDGAVTFGATLSDGSDVLYSGTAGALKVLAGRGPAVDAMTGLLTTKLSQVYSLDVNALGMTADDGSLWVHANGKNTLLGTIANGSAAAPWSNGHAVAARLSHVMTSGAFAIQAVDNVDISDPARQYGIAIGTTAADITMLIPFSAADSVTHLVATAPARDAAGDIVFALAPSDSLPISAIELLTDGTQTEIARVGQPAPGVSGEITYLLRPASMSSSGRIVFFAQTDQIACPDERSCGTVYTGSPGHLYPAAASGYELPGTGSTITYLSLVSGINEKGQFVVKASIPAPHSILLDVAFYLYDPSVGFTRLLDDASAMSDVEPASINSLLNAIPAGDDQFFVSILYTTPSVHTTWALATMSGLTPMGTDIALDPKTFVPDGTGSGGASAAGTGGSSSNAGGATANGGRGGAASNPSGGAAAAQASAGTPAAPGGETQGKTGGCGLATTSRQNPLLPLGILATAALVAIRRRRGARRG